MINQKVVFIVGPTGVGKTEAGLKLAEFMPCEFISADSMQVYKGMDIVTDKLSLPMRRRYPHHLVDVIPLSKNYDVALFCRMALKAARDIIRKKKTPVVIGGTGLYVQSLIYGLGRIPGKDEEFRLKLKEEVKLRGLSYFYEKLKSLDLESAQRVNPQDERRIIRALEVYALTGKPISALRARQKGLIEEFDVRRFGLRRERSELYQRIDQRVDFMVNAGLLDEVRRILKKKPGKTAYCCIGVREMEGFLKGEYDFAHAVTLMKRNSRHFAKRQLTWFNKSTDIEWIDLHEKAGAEDAAAVIFEHLQAGSGI